MFLLLSADTMVPINPNRKKGEIGELNLVTKSWRGTRALSPSLSSNIASPTLFRGNCCNAYCTDKEITKTIVDL